MNLQQWLDYILALHPLEMELGLDRVATVAQRLRLTKPAPPVVTVAGTNGKGSCIALMEGLLHDHGRRTGVYTSPHLHRYNERIRIHGKPVSDQSLVDAFSAIEDARGEIRLTYFEFGTLAALLLFKQDDLDFILLEVGLGGRLDAVNIIDADVAVISSIDLDHMNWLGDNRDDIAIEKAGILRTGCIALCGDIDPPRSLLNLARTLGVNLLLRSVSYGWEFQDVNLGRWWGTDSAGRPVAMEELQSPLLDAGHAATALQVLQLLNIPLQQPVVASCLSRITLAGRYEWARDPVTQCQVVFDIAHNPAAGQMLGERLRVWKSNASAEARIVAVLAMMDDKDQTGFYSALESVIDIWYITQFETSRALPAQQLADRLSNQLKNASFEVVEDLRDAFRKACQIAIRPDDLILVTGSFFTVATIREMLVSETEAEH